MMRQGFTLVEIMIVVAILGLLIAIGVPGFLNARNKSRLQSERANLKAISDAICVYSSNTGHNLDDVIRLWPTSPNIADANSFIRKQLICPVSKSPYGIDPTFSPSNCTQHGSESNLSAYFGS